MDFIFIHKIYSLEFLQIIVNHDTLCLSLNQQQNICNTERILEPLHCEVCCLNVLSATEWVTDELVVIIQSQDVVEFRVVQLTSLFTRSGLNTQRLWLCRNTTRSKACGHPDDSLSSWLIQDFCRLTDFVFKISGNIREKCPKNQNVHI